MGFGIMGKEQIIERWSTMISGASGRGEALIEDTQRLIGESRVSDVRVQRRRMSPSVLRGIMGGSRSLVVITHTDNSNLKPFKMYLQARDYGFNLQVSWYVVIQPNSAEKLMAFLLSTPLIGLLFLPIHLLIRLVGAGKSGVLELDLFDEEDLSAYVTNVHHCALDAVQALMKTLRQDFSRVNRHAQGILGIS